MCVCWGGGGVGGIVLRWLGGSLKRLARVLKVEV